MILANNGTKRHEFDADIYKICKYIGSVEILCRIERFIASPLFRVI